MTTPGDPGDRIATVKHRVMDVISRWLRPVLATMFTGFLAITGTVFGQSHRGSQPVDALAIVLVCATVATILVARRWPVPALVVAISATGAYYLLGYPIDSPFFLGLLVTAYSAGTAGATLRTVIAAVAVLAVFGLGLLVGRASDRQSALFFPLFIVGSLVAGQATAEWRARAERQTKQAHEEEALRRVAEERLRVARELHDVVSHSIAMINVQAGAAAHVIDEHPEQAKAALLAIKVASRDALRDLRGILGVMRDSGEGESRAPAPGLAQAADLVENVQRTGYPVSLEVDAGDPPPTAVDLAAYRVLQEALTNVLRHAPGGAAAAAIRHEAGALVVEVSDTGPSEPVAADGRAGAGHGLAGMRERVAAAGGSLEAGPRAGGGFLVRARFPLAAR